MSKINIFFKRAPHRLSNYEPQKRKKNNAGFSQVAQMFASMVHISRKKIGKKKFHSDICRPYSNPQNE